MKKKSVFGVQSAATTSVQAGGVLMNETQTQGPESKVFRSLLRITEYIYRI